VKDRAVSENCKDEVEVQELSNPRGRKTYKIDLTFRVDAFIVNIKRYAIVEKVK
jgi:hypothetical protein